MDKHLVMSPFLLAEINQAPRLLFGNAGSRFVSLLNRGLEILGLLKLYFLLSFLRELCVLGTNNR